MGAIFLVLLVLAAPALARRSAQKNRRMQKRIESELQVARRTRVAIEQQLSDRDRYLRARVRALYKLVRGGFVPLWVAKEARGDFVRRRAAAKRMIVRDLAERKILRDAFAAALADERRLEIESLRQALQAWPRPQRHSLLAPVVGATLTRFGVDRDPATGALFSRRGIELQTDRGNKVRSLANGRVKYVGELRGLGPTVIVQHAKGLTSVLGGLWKASVKLGDEVAQGDVLGWAWDSRLYLEVRLGGRPINPTPLLRASRLLLPKGKIRSPALTPQGVEK